MRLKFSKAKTLVWDGFFKKISQKRISKSYFKTEGKIFASSAGELCEWKLRHGFLGVLPVIDEPWPGKENKIGDAIHEQIQEDLRNQFGKKVEIEKFVSTYFGKLKVNCKIDAILHAFKEPQILEIKTCKDSEGKTPKREHFYQLQLYLGATGFKKGLLSYFKRSNGLHINTFEIEFDPQIYEEIKDKYIRVQEERDLVANTKSCKFCGYKHVCDFFEG